MKVSGRIRWSYKANEQARRHGGGIYELRQYSCHDISILTKQKLIFLQSIANEKRIDEEQTGEEKADQCRKSGADEAVTMECAITTVGCHLRGDIIMGSENTTNKSCSSLASLQLSQLIRRVLTTHINLPS